jgi:hypothetical protein
LSEQRIKEALRLNLYAGCPFTYNDVKDLTLRFCFSCQMGRMHAFPRPGTSKAARLPLEKIAVDYKGPFRTRTIHHNTGFYLVSDRKTGGVWTYPCVDRGEDVLLGVLQNFFNSVVRPSPYKTKIFQCDYDAVTTSGLIKNFVKSLDLQLQVSAPFCHHQNGQVERAMQSVLDKSRTLLAASHAPLRLWDYAVRMAAYIIQRSPNSTNDKTPFESITGESPDISRLVHFYAPGVYKGGASRNVGS